MPQRVQQMITAREITDGSTVYCEDSRLSLHRAGQTIRALMLNQNELPVCSAGDVDEIIGTAAAFMTIERIPQPTGKASKRAFWSLHDKAAKVRKNFGKK